MSISSVGGSGSVDAAAPQAIIMAKKGLSQQKQDGQNAIALIQAAAPPPAAGHKLSVYA